LLRSRPRLGGAGAFKISDEAAEAEGEKMNRRRSAASLAMGICALTGCDRPPGEYTLYRNSVTDAGMRVHVASFNATDGERYNQENCFTARDLFAKQPGVTVRYWCERGKYQR